MDTHILMVEDDDRMRLALVTMLEQAGYHVTPAANGATALELLAHQHFDVIITDIRMDDIDGIEVLHTARSYDPHSAVILLTGYGSLDTAIAALRAGAYDYLLKPCAPTDLLKCVADAARRRTTDLRQAAAIRSIAQIVAQVQESHQTTAPDDTPALVAPPGTEQPENFLHIGLLRIDRLRREIAFDGELLHVTPTEYALLCCLAVARGRVLSYNEIVRCTHGYETDSNGAHLLLKSHIRNLRRKMDVNYIISVRGIGYMLLTPDQRHQK